MKSLNRIQILIKVVYVISIVVFACLIAGAVFSALATGIYHLVQGIIIDKGGKTIATVLGSQKNISMSGINPPMEIIPCGNPQKEYSDLDIAGFTCIESDFLYKGFNGKLTVGDFIVIGNCGSYSLVMKPPFILPNFPVIDICNDKYNPEVIKRAETFDDLFHTFSF